MKFKFGKNFLFSLLAVAFMWLVWLVAYYCVKNDFVLRGHKSVSGGQDLSQKHH